MPVKKRPIKGRAAKRKGSRAEIKVRNALRTIYPVELRTRVQRVPLSGAGSIKGDVYDANDWDSCYEVKCQESLVLNDWWRQAKNQAGTSRTPVLVITQAYRPFYYFMHKKDWDEIRNLTEWELFDKVIPFKHPKGLMDGLADLDQYEVGGITLDGDETVIVPESYYLDVKKSLWEMTNLDKLQSELHN